MTHEHNPSASLSPDDQRLLDELIESNFELEGFESLSPDEKDRVESLMTLFELLEDYPVEDADDSLVHATLARVDQHQERAVSRMAFSTAAEAQDRGRRRFRMPDLVSMAAIILIGASIVWPLTTQLHRRSIQAACANNLRHMALAFDHYTRDFGGAMPVHHAGLFSSWSPTNHNSINLDPLLEGGYSDRDHLSCPGHKEFYGESYSYQWQTRGKSPQWAVGRVTLVLGDRNPIIDAVRAGRQGMPALSISVNHGGRGQNVLATDGATVWFVKPLFGPNDNIWLPGNVTLLQGEVDLGDGADVFLAH